MTQLTLNIQIGLVMSVKTQQLNGTGIRDTGSWKLGYGELDAGSGQRTADDGLRVTGNGHGYRKTDGTEPPAAHPLENTHIDVAFGVFLDVRKK
jgi:hypothetical protein